MSTTFHIVGFKNYISLFKNPNFWGSLKTTVCYSILLVAGVVTLSLALSLSLNSLKKFRTFTKSVFFVPAMIGGIKIDVYKRQVHRIANEEKLVPRAWMNKDATSVTKDFVDYVKPLLQGDYQPIMVNGLPRHLVLKMKRK